VSHTELCCCGCCPSCDIAVDTIAADLREGEDVEAFEACRGLLLIMRNFSMSIVGPPSFAFRCCNDFNVNMDGQREPRRWYLRFEPVDWRCRSTEHVLWIRTTAGAVDAVAVVVVRSSSPRPTTRVILPCIIASLLLSGGRPRQQEAAAAELLLYRLEAGTVFFWWETTAAVCSDDAEDTIEDVVEDVLEEHAEDTEERRLLGLFMLPEWECECECVMVLLVRRLVGW